MNGPRSPARFLPVNPLPRLCFLLVALALGGTSPLAAAEGAATESAPAAAPTPSRPPWPNLQSPELKATFEAFVRSQIEDEARAGNYSEHQRERTGAFCADYMMVAVRALFAEPVPGLRRQIAEYRGELAGYLVIVLESEFRAENRRLLAMAVPAEEVGEMLLLVYEKGIAISNTALQATAELVLPLHRDPVWRAAVEERRYPQIAVREFILSRERQWNAWETSHGAKLEPAVFEILKTWFNQKTAKDIDFMEKAHRTQP